MIAGGMVPKIRAALGRADLGGAEAVIADASAPSALERALADPTFGTRLDGRTAGGRGVGRGDEGAGVGAPHAASADREAARDRHASATASGRSASSSRASRSAASSELAERLRERGFAVTQATVSRDIAELGLVKVARGERPRLRRAARTSRRRRPPQLATSGCAGSSPTSR